MDPTKGIDLTRKDLLIMRMEAYSFGNNNMIFMAPLSNMLMHHTVYFKVPLLALSYLMFEVMKTSSK